MGACVSRRGTRAECRRCARLPAPSSASPFADAVADAALVRVPPPAPETKRRASFALGRSRGMSPLTASALARKALEEGDARDASDSDEDWRSARSAQTTRSSVDGDAGTTGDDVNEAREKKNPSFFYAEVSSPDGEVSVAADGEGERRSRVNRVRSFAFARPQPRTPPVTAEGRLVADADADAAFEALARATADLEDGALLDAARESSRDASERVLLERGDDGDDGDDRTPSRAGTRRKPKRARPFSGASSRLAKIGEGARAVSAVRAALRKAGGVLDLTAFKGTPIKWHAPHSALLAHARGESTLRRPETVGEAARATRERFANERERPGVSSSESRVFPTGASEDATRVAADVDGESLGVVLAKDWLKRRPPRAARLFTSLWHSFEARRDFADGIEFELDRGGEVSPQSRREEPRLPPAHRRMLAVVSAVLADCEPPALFKKPFNPVLGETARHELGFVSGGSVASVLEQVSHHPPITAFHSSFRSDCATERKGFAAFGHFRPKPSLRGFPFAGKVHIDVEGTRVFRVPIDTNESSSGSSPKRGTGLDAFEDYVTNYVGFEWLFFPTPRARTRAGEAHVVRCDATGLVAEIEHCGSRGTAVRGTVFSVTKKNDAVVNGGDGCHDKTPLYSLRGDVSSRVVAARVADDDEKKNDASFVVYDAKTSAVREATSVGFDAAFDLDPFIDPRGSRATWRAVTDAMGEAPPSWDAARRAKRRVEADERAARAARTAAHEPRLFERDEARDTWVLRADVAAAGTEPRRAPRSCS